jgi:murein DD-endopeptidase MepM/ murein hydrolase activator NlpD
MRRFVFVFCFFLTVATVFAATAFAWQRPVSSPVADPWRPPAHEFASGNRGVDFEPTDDDVVAAGDGIVSFAGSVGGENFVVVDHGNSLKTTYGYLSEIGVVLGDAVTAGTAVGRSDGKVHFGLRVDGEYTDPNILFGQAVLIE